MSTVYDTLEVSEKASKEVIEKAYKVLAKKYHPDLQEQKDKPEAEEKMKQINEAYEMLMDDIKRNEYDKKLEEERKAQELQKEQKQRQKIQNEARQTVVPNPKNMAKQNTNQTVTYTQRPYTKEEYKEAQKQQKQRQKDYIHAYKVQLRKWKAEWTLKKLRDFVVAILIMLGIIAILWFFPPTHKLIMSFYEDNIVIQTIVDAIGNGIKGIKGN